MRVIEEKIIDSIKLRKDFSSQGRDVLVCNGDNFKLHLHGNKVAEKEGNMLYLRDCGWTTQTTASRINAVCKAMNVPLTYRYGQGGYFEAADGKHDVGLVNYNLETKEAFWG